MKKSTIFVIDLDLELNKIANSDSAHIMDYEGTYDVTSDDEYGYGVNSDMTKEEERGLLEPNKKSISPPDRLYGVFLIFGFLGLASLLPWNFFITAKTYFDYKFRNTSLPINTSHVDDATHLQYTFESYLAIVSNGCNMFMMFLTLLLVRLISVKTRIVYSSLMITLVFIATVVMVKINTDSWQDQFLMFTLIMAAIMSGSQSVLTGSVLGLSATFPSIYSQSAMIGQAAGGTFSSVVSIITQWAGGDPTSSGFVYFLIATAAVILALLSYVSLHYLPFSKFHMWKRDTPLKEIGPERPVNNEENKVKFLWSVFKKTWVYCVSACLVFLVTLLVFPAVCSIIKPMKDNDSEWKQKYFTPIVCFLLFNVGDFLGRLFTFVCKFPGPNRPAVFLVMTCLRFGIVPLIMLCNAQPRTLPVYLDNDAYPIAVISLLGLTNGYMGTLCMSFGPLHVESDEAEGAGILMALGMTIGLAGGSFLSLLMVTLL